MILRVASTTRTLQTLGEYANSYIPEVLREWEGEAIRAYFWPVNRTAVRSIVSLFCGSEGKKYWGRLRN
jgi:hypothetical protein